MKRIFHWALFAALGGWLLACTAAPLLSSLAPGSVTVSSERLQEAIAQRFPIKQRLAEVLELEVLPPRLSLLPDSNRLATEIDLNVEPYQTAIARNAPRLAERLFDNRVLHQFSDKDLRLVNGIGLEPGEISVTPQGLRVTLVPRSLSRPVSRSP
jgi:hypothetical protein